MIPEIHDGDDLEVTLGLGGKPSWPDDQPSERFWTLQEVASLRQPHPLARVDKMPHERSG